MAPIDEPFDALVIGGGFYGCAIAIYLARERGFKRILLLERGEKLLGRASYHNQARVHNGYHYPRSFTTAYRSRVNFPRFVRDWPQAIQQDFTHLYAIARRNSKVTARQFERFCREIGASLAPVERPLRQLFEPRLIEDVFAVQEYAFNSLQLAQWAQEELAQCGVRVAFGTRATGVHRDGDLLRLTMLSAGTAHAASCHYAFNCTYSGLNQFVDAEAESRTNLKHEITEMALIRPPSSLQGLGVTVMDGPFFSMMPFPSRGLCTLSHVRYTPHLHWRDQQGIDPYEKLQAYEKWSRADRMVRDAGRYLPSLLGAQHVDSLFEVKTVLVKSEGDDGRPILFEKNGELPGLYSVLGGKIDNIYDVWEKLNAEYFHVA